MRVRRAVPDDLNHIVNLAYEFNDKYFDIPLNNKKIVDNVTGFIEHGSTFVSANGFIGGTIITDLMRDWDVLVEFGWYATDRSGYHLLQTFIKEGYSLGVDEVRMCTMNTSTPLATQLLERKGFVALETSHRLLIN